jgi:alkanesulfonate monooxygenase SsuD/methylene tetrahydromethanopterin reductase-like flavin-dependent oxidoreductase (luciferase family)
VPALTAAAAATTDLRVGALVWDNDYKHPVVLAKELATMDLLSSGRLEIGLGAGWMISDYEQAGMTYDPAPVRIDRFVEGLAIIRLWKDNNALRDRYEAKSDKANEKISTLAARAQTAADKVEELLEERQERRRRTRRNETGVEPLVR